MNEKELTIEQWKEEKRKKQMQFQAMQKLPYEVKVRRAALRAWEYYNRLSAMDCDCHVSV